MPCSSPRLIIALFTLFSLCLVGAEAATAQAATAGEPPKYKPLSRNPKALDISLNDYGANSSAPSALNIGETAPDFRLPQVNDNFYSFSDAKHATATVIVFYRGHW